MKNGTYTRIKDDGDRDAYSTDTVAGPRYQPEMTRTRTTRAQDPFASPDDPPILEANPCHPKSDLKSVSEETRPDVQRNQLQVTSTGLSVSSDHGHAQLARTMARTVSTNSNNARSFMVEGSDNRFLYEDGSEGDLRDHWNRDALIEKLGRNGVLQSPEALWRERLQARRDVREQRMSDKGGDFGVPWDVNGKKGGNE